MVYITITQGWGDAKSGRYLSCKQEDLSFILRAEVKKAGHSVLAFSELGRQIQEIWHLLASQPTLLSELQYSKRAKQIAPEEWQLRLLSVLHECVDVNMCICTHVCTYSTEKHTHHIGRGLKQNERCHHYDSHFAGMQFTPLLPEKTLKGFQCWWWGMHWKQCYKLPTDFIV